MAGLKLKKVYKIYPSYGNKDQAGVQAVTDFNLEIEDGEFIVFVGPSGCGKSTTLRMIAGLEEISRGEVIIGKRVVNDIPAKDRNIAMVFQNYALYPHMTAYENIAFGLRIKKSQVAVLDSNGNPVKVIDKKAINQLRYEIKLLKSTYYLDPEIQKHLLVIKDCKENPSIIKKDKKGAEHLFIDVKTISAEKKAIAVLIKNYKLHGNAICEKGIIEKTKQIKELIENPSLVKTVGVKLTNLEIAEKVNQAAKILGIENLLKRKPKEMSGGQRQRVALGRALVRNPEVFLLDEPLSNLDAKLRVSMRSEIIRLHNELKTTFIYVTHDQVEAMTMGDRIVVMKDGVIQQVDTPTRLFDFPNNVFVAGFIGTPQMNFFDVSIKLCNDKLAVKFTTGDSVSYSLKEMREINKNYLDGKEHQVIFGIRGENIVPQKNGISMKILDVENLGNETQILVNGLEQDSINMKVSYRISSKVGDTISVGFQENYIHLFDKKTGFSIMKDKAVAICKKESI